MLLAQHIGTTGKWEFNRAELDQYIVDQGFSELDAYRFGVLVSTAGDLAESSCPPADGIQK